MCGVCVCTHVCGVCVCVRMRACVCVFFLSIYSACSITVSNTTCTVDILHNYLSSKNSYFFYIQVCRLKCELLFFSIVTVREHFKVFTIFVYKYIFAHG